MEEQNEKLSTKIDISEMTIAGVHLGHRTSKLNPKMSDYIAGIKNTVHVIDLEKTAQMLKTALNFIGTLKKQEGVLMFVSTKPPLRNLVKTLALELKAPFVIDRWLGGTFTNFEVISKRAEYFKKLQEEKAGGEFEKYTKKERLIKEKDLQDLGTKFEGIKNLTKLPQAIFVCDIIKDNLVVKEAKEKGIKTIAIVHTNGDPGLVDYPIAANDDAISSVEYILDKVKATLL